MRRKAWAMLLSAVSRRRLTAKLRRVAMTAGPWPAEHTTSQAGSNAASRYGGLRAPRGALPSTATTRIPPGGSRGRRVAGQDDNTVVPAHYLIDGVSPSRAAACDLADAWADPD